jgi:hypothetical protein
MGFSAFGKPNLLKFHRQKVLKQADTHPHTHTHTHTHARTHTHTHTVRERERDRERQRETESQTLAQRDANSLFFLILLFPP